MKKRILLVICLALVLIISGCGTSKGVSSEEGTGASSESEQSSAAVSEEVQDQIPEEYAMAIIVTINPKVKLYLDADGIITGVEYLNEDAKTAFATIDFSGMTMEQGMNEIVTAAVETEFLADGKTVSIDIAEIKDESCDGAQLCAEAETAVTEAIDNIQVEVQVSATVSAAPVSEEASTEASTEAVVSNPCSNCGGTGKCDECLGDGYRGIGYTVSCPRCHGSLTETCIYCDANGNSTVHEGTCDFPNCMGSHVYACTTCGGGTTPVTCASCNGSGKCKVCGGSGTQ